MANFETKIEELIEESKRAEKLKFDEANACECVITPFVKALGYKSGVDYRRDSSDNLKHNITKKVDYDIEKNGKTIIALEAKATYQNLNKHWEQLHDYFIKADAEVGILTNGIEAWFYIDLDAVNKMDVKPFFIFNFKEHTAKDVERLKLFCKDGFSGKGIKKHARTWKRESEELAKLKENTDKIKGYIKTNIENPSEAFIISIVKGAQAGPFQRRNLDDFTRIIKSAFGELLQGNKQVVEKATESLPDKPKPINKRRNETGLYPEAYKHQNPSPAVQKLYLQYREGIMGIAENSITEKSTSGYFAYKKNGKIFACLRRKASTIRINLKLNKLSDLGMLSGNCKEYAGAHWGGSSCNFYIELDEKSNYSDAIEQIKIACRSA